MIKPSIKPKNDSDSSFEDEVYSDDEWTNFEFLIELVICVCKFRIVETKNCRKIKIS